MTRSYEEAVKQGIIKSVLDIKLSNEAKKVMKEGIVFDQFEADDDKVAVAKINLIDVKKVAEREAFSDYIFPPLKRSFRPTVRIISLVLLAVRKFKEGALKARIKAGKVRKEELDKLKPVNVKFSMFGIVDTEENRKKNPNGKLSRMFNISGVKCIDHRQICVRPPSRAWQPRGGVGISWVYAYSVQLTRAIWLNTYLGNLRARLACVCIESR